MKLNLNYNSIIELPLIKMLLFLRDGERKQFNKLNIGWFVSEDLAEKLVSDYMTEMGDPVYLDYKKKVNDIINLKYEFECVKLAGIILNHKDSDNAEQLLKKFKVPKDPKQVELRLKSLIVRIEVREVEIRSFFKSDGEKTDIVKSTLSSLLSLSKWQGYKLDASKITAYEYAELLKKHNKEARNGR